MILAHWFLKENVVISALHQLPTVKSASHTLVYSKKVIS